MADFLTSFGTNLGFDPRALVASPQGAVNTAVLASSVDVGSLSSVGLPGSSLPFAGSFNVYGSNIKSLKSSQISASVAANVKAATATADDAGPDIVVEAQVDDTRLRIKAGRTSQSVAQVLGPRDPNSNILSMLYETQGLLFPYTPTINVNQTVNWDPISLVQNNYDVNTYQRTPSVGISVTGVFTTQTQREGEYVMAVLHFLRTVTKSYFGTKDSTSGKAGTPPPVVYLDGFGDFMFATLPCVIKSYSYAFDENTDSNVFTSRTGAKARLPAKLSISMELGVQINMNRQRSDFSLDEFRTGALLKDRSEGGWF